MVIPRRNRSAPLRGWQTSPESVAAFAWNQWQLCRGMGGSFAMESVAGFVRNTHVVTDRSGEPLVVMRDVYSNKFLTKLAHGKANAVVLSSASSAEMRKNRGDIVSDLSSLEGVIVLAGGLPVQAAGSIIGAVGVSGAGTGEKDEACVKKGIAAVQERLDFAD